MIIKYNGKDSNLFANFTAAHRQEIFKYFDPAKPEEIMKHTGIDFMKEPNKVQYVQLDEFNRVPVSVYLSCLTQPTIVYKTSKDAGTNVPVAEAIISIYHKRGLKTTIASNILLDGSNNSAIHRFTADLNEFKCNYNNLTGLSDLEKRLFLTLNIGIIINATIRPGTINVVVYFEPTKTLITDRTFITL